MSDAQSSEQQATIVPIALTIAGSDPSGGAGIQADLKTFTALGVYGATVITALTVQNTRGVTGVLPIASDFIAAQFDAVTSDLAVAAVKTGMLADSTTVATVADCLARLRPAHLVVDPVMVATSGDRLIDPPAIEAVRSRLLPLASILTPNLLEAAALLETTPALDHDEMHDQARALLRLGCKAVLLKDGHGTGDMAVDLLVSAQDVIPLVRSRIATKNTHGTGCTLAAALTAGLAQGMTLADAATQAKAFVWQALRSGATQKIGSGNGPLDHLFTLRNKVLPS